MACDRSSWTAEDPYFIEIQRAAVCPDRAPAFRRCHCDPPRYKTPSSLCNPDNFPIPLRHYSGDFQCKNQRSKSVPVKLERLIPAGGIADSSRSRSAATDKKSQPKTSPKGRKNSRIEKIVEEKESKQKADKGTQKAEEIKYTEFLLNITTDIIKNNLNTEKEYEVIFNYHIEANKDKLNERKMSEEIETLKIKLRSENTDVIFDDNDELPGFENMPVCCRARRPETRDEPQMATVTNKDLISGKIAFKLASDKNEPYILLDGPILLPKSLVDKNVTTIILQNSYPVSFQGKL